MQNRSTMSLKNMEIVESYRLYLIIIIISWKSIMLALNTKFKKKWFLWSSEAQENGYDRNETDFNMPNGCDLKISWIMLGGAPQSNQFPAGV